MLEQGPVEASILRQCRDRRIPVPARIKDAPTLGIGLDLFYNAFLELSSCRAASFQEGPIPWVAIHLYCEDNEIVGDQKSSLLYLVRRMDTAFLDFRRKQAESGRST